MLRKLIIAIAILAPIGAGACWILTIPKTLSPSVLGPHTADLENGRILFHAGGCASCHASPNQEDKNRLGAGSRSNPHSAPSTRPTSRPIATMGSGTGRKP